MESIFFVDLLSAIDDLLVAAAPPRNEFIDLIHQLERCKEVAELVPKQLHLANFRRTIGEIKTRAFELQHRQERKQPRADAELDSQEKTRRCETKNSEYAHGNTQAEDYVEIHRMLEAIDWERIFTALGVRTEGTRQMFLRIIKNVLEVPSTNDKGQVFQKVFESRACASESSNQDDNETVKACRDRGMAILNIKQVPHGSQIFGRDGDKDCIIQWLLSDASCNLSAMEIVGEAGVGKTALAKLVFDDSTVKENFSIRAWLHAADGSDAATITKAIFCSITGKSSCSGRESLHLQTIVQEHVKGKRLLLVLDGFKDLHPGPWEHLSAPFSCVRMIKLLITCRRQSDAQETQLVKFYKLHSLPPDLARDLFFKCAFFETPAFRGRYHPQIAPRLIEIGKQIASKCKGLPLPVRALGGLLGYHPNERTWRSLLESNHWKSAKSETLSALQLIYEYMPLYLRDCFLYCTVFPKSYKLDKYELVRLWMAQGYIMPRDNITEEDIGVDYFEQLQRTSFFNRSPDGDGTFTIPDLIYNYFKSKSGRRYSFMKGGDARTISHGVRHLCVIDKSTNNLIFYVGFQLHSFLYKSLDGIVPMFLSSFTAYYRLLRALELKLHDDSAAAPEVTQQPFLDKSNISSINFADLVALRYLRVCDKSMERLPASVCQLHLLQTLDLGECSNLRVLPSDIGNLVNLRYLGLSDASIKILPKSVCNLVNLHDLILDRCRNLSALPYNIGRLLKLHHIGLSRTNIQKLPDSFCHLLKLPILELDNCRQLLELPSSMGNLFGIKFLHVTETKINSLPDSICFMYNLLELDVAGSDLVELPHDIGNLVNLSRLVLSHTNISVLPESLCRLSSLHTLKLDGCKNLACLPSGIGDLAKLGELLLSGANIAELPESICKLSKLQKLDLDGCTRFLSLPRSIGQLTSLCHINLSDTEIVELPASLCQLTNLQTLELNGCYRFSRMPAEIGNLINLRDLQVTETQVSELPRSLCQLSKLKTLYLNGNRKLQELPSGIENLTNLHHLELSQVAIEVLPKQICHLSTLQKLNFG